MKRKYSSAILIIFLFSILTRAQNLVLYTTLNDEASITSPSTGPASLSYNGTFVAAKYSSGFLADAINEFVTFNVGASTGTESGKLNQSKGTIAFWYKPNYATGAGDPSFFFCINTGGSTGYLAMKYENDGSNNNIRLHLRGWNTQAIDDLSSTSWSAGDLVHIAAVWDASGSNSDINGGNSAAIYINGSVTGFGNTTWTPAATNGTNLFIGRYATAQQFADGVIDDFYIYDDVLTSTEINNLKNSQSLLPVELSSFTAHLKDNQVHLNWETATEINNYGFGIERKLSAISSQHSEWETIGFISGHGNSNSPKSYDFIDNESPTGELEYRLKQLDTDGSFEYSETIIVELGTPTKYDIQQNHPNPFNPSTEINYSIPKSGKVILRVYSILGEEVAMLVNENKEAGEYTVHFMTEGSLASGIYITRMESGSYSKTIKMILLR